MAKYHALKQFLLSSEQPKIKLSLSDIEEIIGDKLPYSAYTYNAWWSNKGHSHAEFWTTAGFLTEKVDLTNRTVVFSQQEKTETPAAPQRSTPRSPQRFAAQVFNTQHRDVLTVHGYAFHFVQQLIPECEDGQVKEYAPQREYANHDHLPLGPNGSGTFCRFSVSAPPVSGVYLWIASGEIIYIGETVNLAQRFNSGYGSISGRNCYAHGQSTNCKMNKVVMEYFKKGTVIDLYFLQTEQHKRIEWELLHQIRTKYNIKDN